MLKNKVRFAKRQWQLLVGYLKRRENETSGFGFVITRLA